MPMTWGLSPNEHDLVIDHSGQLVTVYGAEEVRQRILVTLLHNWREYWLNVNAGMPWYELLLGSRDRQLVELMVRDAVLDVPQVRSIPNFQVTWGNRELKISLTAEVNGLNSPEMVDIITALGV